MAEDFRTSKVIKKEEWYTLTAAFLKTIEYPIEATRLSKAQWTNVMKPLLSVALQKAGISEKSPRVMVYTSRQYHGLGLKHPWCHQQLKHIYTLIGETANKTPTGLLIQASVESLRLEIGLPGTFRDVPWKQLKGILISTWLTDLFYFLGEHNLFLHDPLPQLQLQREGDIFLMQCFLLAKPTDIELRRLMDCREYLQVTTLADITSVDGKNILSQTWREL